jgi:hypothetical protein
VLSIGGVGWDTSRPVPWRRLLKEWAIYAAIMTAVFVVFFRDQNLLPLLAGLVVSGPLYLGLGYVLAKFGYQRKTLAELRTPRAAPPSREADSAAAAFARSRPAPTRRTSSGPNRPSKAKRR